MRFAVGVAFAIGVLGTSPAQAAPPLSSCADRFRAAGIDPSKLNPGDRGRLEGSAFIVARGDIAQKICDRVDAARTQDEALRAQVTKLQSELAQDQDKIAELSSGGALKRNYLKVDGGLLAWAVIASIWASYFAGRLDPRRR